MSLENRINDEMKQAMKDADKLRLTTLRSIRASIIEFKKSGTNAEMQEADEFKLLNSQAKKRKDAIEMYSKAGRQDLVDQETSELKIIQEFLPAMMSEEEVSACVNKIIADTGASEMKDFGKVMGMAMKELKDKADGALVQQMVRKQLGA